MKKLLKIFISISLCILAFGVKAQEKKNVILILIDDIGAEAVGCYGTDDYKTPNIDQLAASGIKFENAHATPICTPSRVKIMSGKYNSHNYERFGYLPQHVETFANAVKKEGYTTAIAGKWQLSYNRDKEQALQDPYHFGFDEYCLWNVVEKGQARFKNAVLTQNGKQLPNKDIYGPDVINGFVNSFVKKNKKKPFFVYYTMMLTHDPFQPVPGMAEYDTLKDLSLNDPKYFQSNVEYMDKMIGQIVKNLEKNKIRENTVIMLIGDNGTSSKVVTNWQGQQIKGGKGKSLTTGSHVPFVANCPGYIQPNVNTNLVDLTDFYPTLMDITGAKMPDTKLNGISFHDQLIGKEPTEIRDFVFISYFGKKTYPVKQYAFNTKYKYYSTGEFYNTKKDPAEKKKLDVLALSSKEQKQYDFLKAKVEELKKPGDFTKKKKKKKGKGKGIGQKKQLK
ncbi:sulfatase-like hydrolase/transferase [Flammeovirga agarivorans]|uniref:Sulfatase-like hydrolase/transferase n=1 Tax=Flammeovirga agarivorans TaxID=2726742 RepID=A0A7X8SPM8_9BACT|nr:sulfatase-like hydrolase/transferase [Flammeovirga agarivorans]NLR94080.1 sulfatase-like hydrolase/transferase [Flammeovirga agarivorans]